VESFEIAGRKVGLDHPPLVIAEVGINHEGSVDKALELVDAAAAAGAELLKFQYHQTLRTECRGRAARAGILPQTRLDLPLDAILAGGRGQTAGDGRPRLQDRIR
jgi:hypothetical protein